MQAEVPSRLSHDLSGGLQHGFRGTVIGGKLDDPGPGIVLAEPVEKAHVRAPESVDGLIRISDHGQVGVRRAKKAQQPVLDEINVLEFIHAHMGEACLKGSAILGVGLDGPDGLVHKVVEIQ